MRLDQFSALIGAIYEAGADARKWEQDVLCPLADLLHAPGVMMSVRNLCGSNFSHEACFQIDPAALAEFKKYYCSISPITSALTRVSIGEAVSARALTPPREMLTSEFFNDFALRFNIEGSSLLVLDRAQDSITCLSVIRRPYDDPAQGELEKLTLLGPHLLRALQMNRLFMSIQGERNAGFTALESLEAATFLLRDDGFLAHSNFAGEALLRAGDGLILRNRKVRATHPETARMLARRIHDAINETGEHGGVVTLPRKSGRQAHSACVLPVRAQDAFFSVPQIRAVLFVSNPEERSRRGVEHMAMAHGLTDTETRLVAQLVDGKTLKETAEVLQITKGTARKHLAHIMAKTETNRQAELIGLVLAGRLPLR